MWKLNNHTLICNGSTLKFLIVAESLIKAAPQTFKKIQSFGKKFANWKTSRATFEIRQGPIFF